MRCGCMGANFRIADLHHHDGLALGVGELECIVKFLDVAAAFHVPQNYVGTVVLCHETDTVRELHIALIAGRGPIVEAEAALAQ